MNKKELITCFVVCCDENTFIEFYSDVMVNENTYDARIRYVGNWMYGYFSFTQHDTNELYDFMQPYTHNFTNIKDKTFIAFKGCLYIDPMDVYHDVSNLDNGFEHITNSNIQHHYMRAVDCTNMQIPKMIEDADFDKYREILNSRICDKTEKRYVITTFECVFISYKDMIKLYANYGYAVDMSMDAYTIKCPEVKEMMAQHFNNKNIVQVKPTNKGYYIMMN